MAIGTKHIAFSNFKLDSFPLSITNQIRNVFNLIIFDTMVKFQNNRV